MNKIIKKDYRSKQNLVLLEKICRDIPITDENGFGSLVNYSTLSDEPVHRWFRYREGYSTQLVKRLISGLPKGSIILDPFCGCGTTLLAAQDLGYESYGFDINPLSVLIARVKTKNYSNNDLNEIELLRHRIIRLHKSSPSDDPPILSIVDKIFHPDILSTLLILRRFIKSIDKIHIREFMMVAWLSILEDVSNVFKEGNGIKYRNRKRTPQGYITISDEEWQNSLFPDDKFKYTKQHFANQISQMLTDATQRNRKLPIANVIEQSAEIVDQYIRGNSISYIVFSPPYCNCFNYFKIFKVELWMGEFVKTYKELQGLNRRAMRSHVETKMCREDDKQIAYVDDFVKLIDRDNLWDRRIPKAVQGYFIDMKKILASLHRVLRPEGVCTIVVGNSAYSGILIPTDALLSKIGVELGFRLEKISIARHLTTSSQQKMELEDRKKYLRESLVILKKPDPRLEEKKLIYVEELPKNSMHRSDEVYVIRNNGLCNLTHKFHRFPGKFIPHIPRWAIQKYLKSEDKVVFDPFCGSGTTLVESMLLGHNSYGIDVDPIARLVSQVKTTPIDIQILDKCLKDVKKRIHKMKEGTYRPQIDKLMHWFNEQAVKDLSAIREVIESYRNDDKLYNFLLVCFISIVRRVSNADNQTQKTYVSHTYEKVSESAKPLFEKVIDDYATRLKGFANCLHNGVRSTILPYNDSRDFYEKWKNDRLPFVDLAITSPPYLKSVDYIYNQMAEYFWIGDLFSMENQHKQNEYKKQYIGTQRIEKSEYNILGKTHIQSIDEISEKIYLKNKKHAHIVYKYFKDMLKHLVDMRNILKKGSHYVMVVGDSLISNEPILVHKLIQDCGYAKGFKVNNMLGYEIRNRHMRFPRLGRGGIVRYDWIVDFSMEG